MVSTKFNSSYNASQDQQNIHLPTTFDLLRSLLANEHESESLKFVATDCLGVTTLGFVEIDDIPNGVEILAVDRVQRTDRTKRVHPGTHVGLYIEILQVEGMLPNVDTDYGNV